MHYRLLTQVYRTLSINVTDTISHGVEPVKGKDVKSISELEWHSITAQEALRRLTCSETQGLDNNQAQRRLQKYGKNVLSPPPTRRIRKLYVISVPS
jgi:sodium/potassium-transporting ATPase subunit alpha